jgi:hypothetical protein
MAEMAALCREFAISRKTGYKIFDHRDSDAVSTWQTLEFGSCATWCEVEYRRFDWASRSLKREFEEVIMVEVRIEEMFGSD